MEFNLTLDLQNLRQEIDGLLRTRDLLQSRALVLRQDPTGSLAQTMRAYYQVFRCGYVTADQNAETAAKQKAFLHSVVDQEIDFGNDLRGIDVMVAQGVAYSALLRVISLDMDRLEVAEAGDSVVVRSQGRFRVEINRKTILGMFPYVAGNERIMARLVGRVAEVATSMAFYFDSSDKIVKMDADMDFVSTFLTLLHDPQNVSEQLGQALIADNCMIGLEDGDATDNRSPRIEIVGESEFADAAAVYLPEELASNRATRSDIANANTTNGSSMDETRQLQAAHDNCSNAMSMAYILGQNG